MKALIFVLITTRIAVGQISSSASFSFRPSDLVNQYVIFWDVEKGSAVGENIVLKKSRKFSYSVFTIGNGVGYVEKSMAKGRYKVDGDTVKITIKEKSYSSKASDVFSLRPYYLIRTTTRKGDENKGSGYLICLVPGDKVDAWNVAVKTYLAASVDKATEQQFWREKIFTH